MIPGHVKISREILKVRRRRVELQGLAIFGSPRRPRITRELSLIAKSLYDLIHISTAPNMRIYQYQKAVLYITSLKC
jgi:hypothetical protein